MLHRSSMRVGVLAVGLAGLICGAVTASTASATTPPFELTFVGWHEPDPASPAGFTHVGTFAASGAFCASGRIKTLSVTDSAPGNAQASRLLACEDGSGTATALVSPVQNEHGGIGNWRIVGGAGAYEKLRGHGTFTSVRTGGDPLNEFTLDFRSAWTGTADLDDAAPTVGVSTAAATKLRRPTGAYSVKLALALQDNIEGNPVSYTVRVTAAGVELARKFGTSETATLVLNLRIRPRARVKAVRLLLSAEDPVGNEATTSRSLRLPR
jgi:hypothetical protein